MSRVTKANLSIDEGSGVTFYFDVKQSGSAVDLTGYTVVAEARKYDDDSVVLTLPTAVTTALSGEITMTLTAANADTLEAAGEDNLIWDMYLTPSGGEAFKSVEGVVTISQGQ